MLIMCHYYFSNTFALLVCYILILYTETKGGFAEPKKNMHEKVGYDLLSFFSSF